MWRFHKFSHLIISIAARPKRRRSRTHYRSYSMHSLNTMSSSRQNNESHSEITNAPSTQVSRSWWKLEIWWRRCISLEFSLVIKITLNLTRNHWTSEARSRSRNSRPALGTHDQANLRLELGNLQESVPINVNKSIRRPEMVSGSIRVDNCLHKLLTPALINYTFSNVSQASVMSFAINEKRTERWFTMSDYVTWMEQKKM